MSLAGTGGGTEDIGSDMVAKKMRTQTIPTGMMRMEKTVGTVVGAGMSSREKDEDEGHNHEPTFNSNDFQFVGCRASLITPRDPE